jgi:hypothetical protein
MTLPNIALMGRARSGKDTVAAHLGRTQRYVPFAFASPLKTAAEKLNPIISAGNLTEVRLLDALDEFGWEGAKDAYPEVRRILQHMGQGVRDLDPDFWVAQLMRQVWGSQRYGARIVVTDVRYPNEADVLKLNGFVMVRVERPSLTFRDQNSGHVSEVSLAEYPHDRIVFNSGTPEDLYRAVDALVRNL